MALISNIDYDYLVSVLNVSKIRLHSSVLLIDQILLNQFPIE